MGVEGKALLAQQNIVVHEMPHLGFRDHSQRFWYEVARVMPDYMARRQKLAEVGIYLTL